MVRRKWSSYVSQNDQRERRAKAVAGRFASASSFRDDPDGRPPPPTKEEILDVVVDGEAVEEEDTDDAVVQHSVSFDAGVATGGRRKASSSRRSSVASRRSSTHSSPAVDVEDEEEETKQSFTSVHEDDLSEAGSEAEQEIREPSFYEPVDRPFGGSSDEEEEENETIESPIIVSRRASRADGARPDALALDDELETSEML